MTADGEPREGEVTGTAPRNPYVGLRPFSSREAILFFGRRRLTIDLMETLHRARYVAVVGGSGSGKSSLVRAGLIPKLQAGFLVGDRDHWRMVKMTPGGDPRLRLADAFVEALPEIRSEDSEHSLAEAIERRGAAALTERLGPLLDTIGANLLLLVDQFEEIFRFVLGDVDPEAEEEAGHFVSLLLELSEQRKLPIFVVTTMRSDYIGDCDRFRGLPEALNRSQYLVPRMDPHEIRQAIESPARLYGRSVAPRLVDRLLSDLGGRQDQLPVLQHALLRMWERLVERQGELLDLDDYDAVGTLDRALAQDAEGAIEGWSEEQIATCELVFRALTDVDASNRRVRHATSLADLQAFTERSREQVEAVVERFRGGGRSFLRLTGPADDERTLVDISHESLIRQWPRLTAWVDKEAGDRRRFATIVEAAERWKRGQGALWRHPDLGLAERWWKSSRPRPAWARRAGGGLELAREFLRASRRERDRVKRRKRLVVPTALAAALILVVLPLLLWQQSRRAKSAAMAVSSVNQRDSDPEESLRLALTAIDTASTGEAWIALGESLKLSAIARLWSVSPAQFTAAAFDSAGSLLAVGDRAGRVGIWDVATGDLRRPGLCGPRSEVVAIAWADGDSRLLTAQFDGSVTLWDLEEDAVARALAAKSESATVDRPGSGLLDLDLAPDGRQLAMAKGTDGVWLLDRPLAGAEAGTPRRVTALPEEVEALEVEYAAAGDRLAIAGTVEVDGSAAGASPRRAGRIWVWEPSTGRLLCETEEFSAIYSLAASEGGGAFSDSIAAGIGDFNIWWWKLDDCAPEADGRPARIAKRETFLGERGEVAEGLAFGADGSYLISAGSTGSIKIWRPGEPPVSRPAGEGALKGLAAHRRGPIRVATFSHTRDDMNRRTGALTLWDAADPSDLSRLLAGPPERSDSRADLRELAERRKVDPRYGEREGWPPSCPP